jgi:hypothetical protein
MWRIARRHKSNLRQFQFVPGRFSHQQMPNVYGVKRAPKNS